MTDTTPAAEQFSADRPFVFRNATVITRDEQGVLEDADVLVIGRDIAAVHKELSDAYTRENVNPYLSVARGELDAIITPEDTRSTIVSALRVLRTKDRTHPGTRRHGNMPM